MKAFLTGLGMGAVIGLSMAPDTGEATRRRILRGGNSLLERLEGLLAAGVRPAQRGQQAKRKQQHHGAQDEVAQVLNTARKDELTSVKGIGDVTAKRIIKNRPFESAEEVLEKNVVPEPVLENIKQKLVVQDEEVA